MASCDDDDLWHPAKVRLQVERLRSDPELLAVGSGIRLLMGERGDVDWPAREEIVTHARLLHNRVKELHSSTLMIRRTAFDEAGLYDEDLPHGYAEDYDWLLRATRVGPVGAVPGDPRRHPQGRPVLVPDRALNTATALEYLLEKHPDFRGSRRGHARILGQIAYARAAAGERRPRRSHRRPGAEPLPRRAARLARARGRRPPCRTAPDAVGRASTRTGAVMTRLPNFLYVGPDKAGSSWLHETLMNHPDVYLTPAKDLYFFDRYFDRGIEWYAGEFRGARDEKVVGEICQDYLFHPEAAERIRATLGQVRTMVCLRDPVERAWSSYLYMRKHGIGPDSFAEALRSRPELLGHGRYATGLDRFFERFPRDTVHVALFDDLVADPQRFLDGVTDFLGIERLPLTSEELAARLPAAKARSVRIAGLARHAADWVREHDGARFVGAVKRSPLVHRVLYQPIDRDAVRPEPDDVVTVRAALAPEIESLERTFGLRLREAWGW